MSEQGLIEAPKAQTNEMQDTSNPARRAADKAVEQVVEKPELNLGSAEDFKSFAAQGNGNGSKTEEEIRNGFWRYHREHMFPESVIVANTSKLNYTDYTRK